MEKVLDHQDTAFHMFPKITANYILAFQFSSWFSSFSSMSIRSTIVKPLDHSFINYLESDRVFIPEGSENVLVCFPVSDGLTEMLADSAVESTLPDDNENGSSDGLEPDLRFSFPELDTAIRAAIDKYQAVFPKLNFSSPKDATWVLPMSSPLKCTSPADVYLLLKSSDFISHDLDVKHVFEGCDTEDPPRYDLELILRKWYPVDRSREIRCFVRHGTLIGISQRDMNFYDYMIDPIIQTNIKSTVHRIWREDIQPRWTMTQPDYVFDLLLTRDLSRGYILDFNPYAPRTDPLLFTYEELYVLAQADGRCHYPSGVNTGRLELPEFRVIDSPMHPAATSNAPVHQHNMVPIEALSLSEGKSITEFTEIWRDQVNRAMQDEEEDRSTRELAG